MDAEERALERKAAEGDQEAASALELVKARRAASQSYATERGSRYVQSDAEANEALGTGDRVTMRLEKGDVVRVEPLMGHPWIGVHTETKFVGGTVFPYARVLDLLDAEWGGPRVDETTGDAIMRDAKIFVLRRRGRRLR